MTASQNKKFLIRKLSKPPILFNFEVVKIIKKSKISFLTFFSFLKINQFFIHNFLDIFTNVYM